MSGTPFVGLDSTVTFGSGSPPSNLNGITGISFSGDKVSMEKTTDMKTPNGTDTFIASTDDPGTCDIKCWNLPEKFHHRLQSEDQWCVHRHILSMGG
jgi:hypothetical protein